MPYHKICFVLISSLAYFSQLTETGMFYARNRNIRQMIRSLGSSSPDTVFQRMKQFIPRDFIVTNEFRN